MKQWKKRLVVFLCTILVAPTVLQALPIRPMAQVEAGNAGLVSYLNSEYDRTTGKSKYYPLTVEVGEKVDLGYFFEYYNSSNGDYKAGLLSSLKKGVSYTSNKSSVATVGKTTGTITPKKTGTATITIKYAGKKVKVPVKVVKKGALKLSSYAKYEKNAKGLAGINPKKINSKNEYAVLKKINAYEKSYDGWWEGKSTLNERGMRAEKEVQTYGDDVIESYTTKNVVVAPSMVKACNKSYAIYEYFSAKNPIGTIPSKQFKVKSVSVPKAGAKTFTIKLKKKVTASQICTLKVMNSSLNNGKNDGKAYFYISLLDEASGKYMDATATAKKGSDKITVTVKKSTDPYMSKKTKFTKGKYSIQTDWLTKKFTVK